jgi:hypothetical protein
LIVSNKLAAQLDAAVGSLRVTSNAEIAGDVNYFSRREAEVEPGARIGGKLVHNPPPRLPQPSPEKIFMFFTGLGVFLLLTGFTSTLILGLFGCTTCPSITRPRRISPRRGLGPPSASVSLRRSSLPLSAPSCSRSF